MGDTRAFLKLLSITDINYECKTDWKKLFNQCIIEISLNKLDPVRPYDSYFIDWCAENRRSEEIWKLDE